MRSIAVFVGSGVARHRAACDVGEAGRLILRLRSCDCLCTYSSKSSRSPISLALRPRPVGIRMSRDGAGDGERLLQYASGLPTLETGAPCMPRAEVFERVSFAASLLRDEGKWMCLRNTDGGFSTE